MNEYVIVLLLEAEHGFILKYDGILCVTLGLWLNSDKWPNEETGDPQTSFEKCILRERKKQDKSFSL